MCLMSGQEMGAEGVVFVFVFVFNFTLIDVFLLKQHRHVILEF